MYLALVYVNNLGLYKLKCYRNTIKLYNKSAVFVLACLYLSYLLEKRKENVRSDVFNCNRSRSPVCPPIRLFGQSPGTLWAYDLMTFLA